MLYINGYHANYSMDNFKTGISVRHGFVIRISFSMPFTSLYSLISKLLTLPKVSKVFSLFLNAKSNGDEWIFSEFIILGLYLLR